MNDLRQTPYDLLGGDLTVRRLVNRFYDHMDTDPEFAGLRRMHATDLTPMREKLGDFLIGWMGGPPIYHQRPDSKCMSAAHAPYTIDDDVARQWVSCMSLALNDIGASDPLRAMLSPAFERVAQALRTPS